MREAPLLVGDWRLLTTTPPPTLDEYIAAWMERDRLREELLDWMADNAA